MSWLEEKGNPNCGVLVLQHHGYEKQQFDLDYRAFKGAVRVVKRPIVKGIALGSWQEDPETRGDIIGGWTWRTNRAKRPINAWRFSWPVEISEGGNGTATPGGGQKFGAEFTDTPTESGKGAAAAGGQGCAVQGSSAFLPLWHEEMEADDRFEPSSLTRPQYASGEFLWPKFPVAYKGIGLAGDDESEQVEYYLPVDPRLVAVHHEGDPEMGTNVVDMAPDFKIDVNRHSRLHTILRVIKGPVGCVPYHGRNSLAINFTDAGCEDVRGGLWIDRPPAGGATGTGKERVIATFGQRDSGPLECGMSSDKHGIGSDVDGNFLNAGHLSLNAYFWQSSVEDGPLQYDGIFSYQRAGPPPIYTKGTHYTDVFFEFDPQPLHPFVCGDRPGRYKWRATTIIYIPSEGRVPPDRPERPPVRTPGGGVPVSRGEWLLPVEGFTFAQPSGSNRRSFAAVTLDFALPSILGRPQHVNSGWHDLRTHAGAVGEIEGARYDEETPIVGRLEWIGEQQQSHFVYTQQPNVRTGRWRSGSGNGGVWLLPAEVDMADENTNFAPPGIARSTTYLGVLRTDSYFASGLPRPENGGVESGYRWQTNALAQLVFEQVDADGVATDAIRFGADGTFAIADPVGGSWATQYVAANLVDGVSYEWPSRSGTVVLQLGSDPLTTGSIPFADAAGRLTEDNANFFWDNTNNRLGLGTVLPASKFHVKTTGVGASVGFIRGENTTAGEEVSILLIAGSQNWSFENFGGPFRIADKTASLEYIRCKPGADEIVVNETGNAYVDLRVEGDTQTHLLFTDASADCVGLGTNAMSNGTRVLSFGDGTAPTTVGLNTAGLYANDVAGTVEMFAIDEAGVATQISSHRAAVPELGWDVTDKATEYPLPHVLWSKSHYTGDEQLIDVMGMARVLEELIPGRKFLYHRKSAPTLTWAEAEAWREQQYDAETARVVGENRQVAERQAAARLAAETAEAEYAKLATDESASPKEIDRAHNRVKATEEARVAAENEEVKPVPLPYTRKPEPEWIKRRKA